MTSELIRAEDLLPPASIEGDSGAKNDDADQLPDIRINGRELRDVSAEALEAIAASNKPPRLFSRAASVVRVDTAEEGRPLVVGVTDVHLRGEMTRSANFHKIGKRGGITVRTSASPPLDAARDILSRPVSEFGFPPLESLTEAPFIRSDGGDRVSTWLRCFFPKRSIRQ